MDPLGLAVLQAELKEDCRVIAEAASLARARFGAGSTPELEASAYQLARLYNAVEQMGLRLAKAFENKIDDEQGWHTELLRRLSIEIRGVRPAFLASNVALDMQELRGFRHVVRHAYDLILDKNRIAPLVEAAQRVANALPELCANFFARVAKQQGWTLPEE